MCSLESRLCLQRSLEQPFFRRSRKSPVDAAFWHTRKGRCTSGIHRSLIFRWLEIGADRAILISVHAWQCMVHNHLHSHHQVQVQRMLPVFSSITLSQHHRHALASLVGLLLLDRSLDRGMGAKERPRSP